MDAPEPVKVADVPAQIAVELETVVIVGVGLTTKFTVLVDVHPNAFEPVTVYTVVATGDTEIVEVVNPPGLQV